MKKRNQHPLINLKYFFVLTALIVSITQLGWIFHDNAQYIPVRVHTGDTVWNIASAAVDSGTDVRDVVDGILKVNHLSNNDDIYPGQILQIPVHDSSIETVKSHFDVQL
ncbi:MAG: LysM peptidoglycan-binding domain-containing protein [Megasphaera sp.]|jgi:hypothetical protein|uniref:LysM peptidoglycan-binding domain-containing protein n=1 Tax=Megasphaera sueciensis TaxID=349094 RepID=UPI003CFE7293|nr:LysM peptidoglycan-binding domain-containing protein [Megasphaera sp.]MCI1823030.1 LysM peptidoglycan-binding domain-containing protein [Megasphaera sp.]